MIDSTNSRITGVCKYCCIIDFKLNNTAVSNRFFDCQSAVYVVCIVCGKHHKTVECPSVCLSHQLTAAAEWLLSLLLWLGMDHCCMTCGPHNFWCDCKEIQHTWFLRCAKFYGCPESSNTLNSNVYFVAGWLGASTGTQTQACCLHRENFLVYKSIFWLSYFSICNRSDTFTSQKPINW